MRKMIFVVAFVVAMTIIVGGIMAQMPPPLEIEGAEVVAEGLNLPQGVLVDPDGNIWVVDAGVGGEDEILFAAPGATEPAPSPFGVTSRVMMFTPEGELTEVAFLPSIAVGMEVLGGARLALHDGTLYATSGQWIMFNGPDRQELMGAVVSIGAEGEVTEVANTWAFEEANNPDGLVVDSHPYGLTSGPDGWLWMADAGANTLVRINPEDGAIELVTAFEGLPGPFPNPARDGAMEADPVPTAVAFDADGNAYVSLLSGFPFAPGGTKVVAVSADGEVSDYATGLTMLTDLVTAPNGEMYAVQIAQFGAEGPVPNSGAIVRIKEGDASEVVFSGLPNPTSVSFDADGNAYVVINGGFAPPGFGALIRIDGLTEMEGTPVGEMMEEGGDA